jgi:hypothetical protein
MSKPSDACRYAKTTKAAFVVSETIVIILAACEILDCAISILLAKDVNGTKVHATPLIKISLSKPG